MASKRTQDQPLTERQCKDGEATAGPKKTYGSPCVTRYGTLKDLTAGGTGHANESSQGMKPRP